MNAQQPAVYFHTYKDDGAAKAYRAGVLDPRGLFNEFKVHDDDRGSNDITEVVKCMMGCDETKIVSHYYGSFTDIVVLDDPVYFSKSRNT